MTERRDRIREARIQFAQEAAARWRERERERSGAQLRYQEGGAAQADTQERSLQFQGREALRRSRNAVAAAAGFAFTRERQIGPTLDFTNYAPDEEARSAGRPVARIVELPAPGVIPDGFATGFLISPRLLMTNHHVFPSLADARGVGANFFHEFSSAGLNRGPIFELDPETFYLSDEQLDFAIVAVQPVADDGTSLDAIHFIPLIATTGKILVGHPISIIQHPAGGPKQYATTQNKLLDVLDAGFLHYTTDTLPGSSGSPAFNVHWELVALHHSGVPMIQDGKFLRKDGTPWDPSMPEDEIQWVANEGVRVSSIVQGLNAAQIADPQRMQILHSLLTEARDPLTDGTLPADAIAPVLARRDLAAPRGITINVAGHAFMNFGTAVPAAPARPAVSTQLIGAAAPAALPVAVAVEKKLRFDPNYKARDGYNEDFLNGVAIPLPKMAANQKGEVSRELHYHHFTLVMNRKRRLVHWSAVNVDYTPGKKSQKPRAAFGTDTWIADPRLPGEQQIQDDDFYKPATKVDRGHIVRREDNAWGEDELEIEFANSDTFHWTNCTPQHERFNQERQSGLWGQLEGLIKNEIGAVGNRASIFAGPILADDDPAEDYGYGSIQYPLRFWKIVAGVNADDGQLAAYGFVLDQSAVVQRYGLEGMNLGRFHRYQVAISEIGKEIGVTFPDALLQADVLRPQNGGAPEKIELKEIADVRLRSKVKGMVGAQTR